MYTDVFLCGESKNNFLTLDCTEGPLNVPVYPRAQIKPCFSHEELFKSMILLVRYL